VPLLDGACQQSLGLVLQVRVERRHHGRPGDRALDDLRLTEGDREAGLVGLDPLAAGRSAQQPVERIL